MKDAGRPSTASAVHPSRARADPAHSTEVSIDLTTELRWFIDGRLPAEVLDWFTHGGSAGLLEDRSDTYRLDDQVDIGVKRRFRTTLELKLRLRPPEPLVIEPDVEGWLETWRRWSPADGRIHLSDDATWVDVHKAIVKRRFGSDGRELPLSEETRAMTGQGCDAEVATASLGGRTDWTIAFAAFGPTEGHRPSLELAWRSLVTGRPRPSQLQLHLTNSCGYPQWMANGDSSLQLP